LGALSGRFQDHPFKITMSWLLNCVYVAMLLLASPWIVWRRVAQGRYRRGWGEKLLGRLPVSSASTDARPAGERETLWLHAVSVGELQVLRPVIEYAERERPELRVVVTTSTDSGFELALKLYARHTVCFAPLDFTWAVREAMDRVAPTVLVLAELELWPNWIREASRRGIPVAILNARLSARSLKGYQRIGWLIRPIVQRLTWIGAQSEGYRQRFLTLGCSEAQVAMTGNIKFDGASHDRTHSEVERRRSLLGLRDSDIVWLCGSTQAPEELHCLNAYLALEKRYPQLKLILVPRHVERFAEVAKLIADTGLAWDRRSLLGDRTSDGTWKIFLADSVGELRWWWGVADLGFVGGSFGTRGGQNMIEPCAYGVATSFGPNTRNFTDVVQLLLERDAAQELDDPQDLEGWVATMLEHPDVRRAMAERAIAVTGQHRGAVARTWSTLATLLDRVPQTR